MKKRRMTKLKLLMLMSLAASNCILGEAKKGRQMDAKHEIAGDELSTAARGSKAPQYQDAEELDKAKMRETVEDDDAKNRLETPSLARGRGRRLNLLESRVSELEDVVETMKKMLRQLQSDVRQIGGNGGTPNGGVRPVPLISRTN